MRSGMSDVVNRRGALSR